MVLSQQSSYGLQTKSRGPRDTQADRETTDNHRHTRASCGARLEADLGAAVHLLDPITHARR
jgi:hypothetical protein